MPPMPAPLVPLVPDEPPVVSLLLLPDEPLVPEEPLLPEPVLPAEPLLPEPVLPEPVLPEPVLPLLEAPPLFLDDLPDEPDVLPPLSEPDELPMLEAPLPEPVPPPAPLLWAKEEPASMAADTSSAIDNFFIPCSLISCE
jgi:hypothetical protein